MLFYKMYEIYSRLLRSTVNNFVNWPHNDAVMHCSGKVEPQDCAVSVLLSSQQVLRVVVSGGNR
jgi:hypothetical protein